MSHLSPRPIVIGRLRLVFAWRGDRFGHALQMSGHDADAPETTLLVSVEGSQDEAWPASPVLQEFHWEPRAGGQSVALLVGRAGRSHWSLSVLCDPARETCLFEAACRVSHEPERLGSSYAYGAEAEATGSLTLERGDGGVVTRGGETLWLPAPAVAAGGGFRTVCWSYRVGLV